MEENKKKENYIVKLNVGGKLYHTTKLTLTSCGPNYFTALLSGKFETTKIDDHYFIDRDGDHFKVILDFLRTGEWILFGGLNAYIVQREALFYSIQYPNIENLYLILSYSSPSPNNPIIKPFNSTESNSPKGIDKENSNNGETKRKDSFSGLPDSLAIFQLKWIGKNQDCPILYFLTKSNSKAIAIAHAKHKANQIFLKQLEGHKHRGWQIIHIETKQNNSTAYDSFNAYLIKPPNNDLFPPQILFNQIQKNDFSNLLENNNNNNDNNSNNNNNNDISQISSNLSKQKLKNNIENLIDKEVDLDKDQFEDF